MEFLNRFCYTNNDIIKRDYMTNKNRGSFLKKFKHQSKTKRIFFIIIGLAYIISLAFFTHSILSLTGIETVIRIIVLAFLYLFVIVYILGGIICMFTKRNKSFIAILVIATIFTPVLSLAAYYIDKTYGVIDNVQKKYVDYTSVMISKIETTEYKKIGMISAKDDPTGYILPQEMIKKEQITSEIIEYDDYISMISELYEGNIDAMFVADSYVTMFNSYEKFSNIDTEVKVVYKYTKKLENKDNVVYSTKDLTKPFTILLMGVDSTGDGIASSSSFNGDSLMLISFNPKTLAATVFSIPRDTYVPIACSQNRENKINSSAYGGTTCVVNTIQNLTGINIDYYVKINFTGVVRLVDDLGGVTVDVPMDFCEQDSERRFGDNLICLTKGEQRLNGEQALALARHRHSLPLGDFQRVQNQQLVVEAMVKELKNVASVEDFYTILNDVVNNIDTNMTTPQILSLYQVAKNVLLNKLGDSTSFSIQKTYLTGYDLTMYMPNSKSYVYTFQYYKQSLEEIVDAMKVNLELKNPTLIKTFSFDANETYELKVAGKTYFNETRRELLPNFVGQRKSYVESWALERNIAVNYIEVNSSNPLYNINAFDGEIVAQTEHQGQLVEKLTSITVYVIKKDNTSTITPPSSDNDVEEKEETLPDFKGMSLSDFNKWKNSLKNSNMIIDIKELTADDLISLNITDLKDNTIYKQSHSKGTQLESISTLIVYYYKEQD